MKRLDFTTSRFGKNFPRTLIDGFTVDRHEDPAIILAYEKKWRYFGPGVPRVLRSV